MLSYMLQLANIGQRRIISPSLVHFNCNRRCFAQISKSVLDAIPESSTCDESLWSKLRDSVNTIDHRRLVVLDDDPTGCQTVYDCNILLDYSVEGIKKQLLLDDKLFYILTNTRSMTKENAIKVTKEVVDNVHEAAGQVTYRHPLQFISRSDSTLRGHYPSEIDAISERNHPMVYDATIILPAFFEGGRVTFNDIHYVEEGDYLTPASETIFAQDQHFGFKSSNLIDWVVEKSTGSISRNNIFSIALNDIRNGGSSLVTEKLESLPVGSVVVVNVVHQHDLNTFVLGLLQAEANGCNFIYRTAASFIASRAALEPRGLLNSKYFSPNSDTNKSDDGKNTGGLIVVGSYVEKTTKQLKYLLSKADVVSIEVDASHIIKLKLNPGQHEYIRYRSDLVTRLEKHILGGESVVLFTSRTYVDGATLDDLGRVSTMISDIVELMRIKPSFLVAKGGITSNDIASRSLSVKAAQVVGQILPGIPVWKLGMESKFPGLNYIVFPGNVGSDDALYKVSKELGVADKKTDNSGSSSNSSSSSSSNNSAINFHSNSKKSNMSIVHMLLNARSKQTAIAAFNVYNLEGAKAAVSAAESLQSPVILQVHPSSLHFGGRPLIAMLKAYREYSSIPVYIHLDHSTHEQDVVLALECGVDSIMVDGSAMSLEKNIQWTQQMVQLAHAEGIFVEAELGRLVGEEDGLSVSEKESKMTDPNDARLFVRETKVDMLAVTIGNVHGNYLKTPQLDFDRLRSIRSKLSDDIPLVLHGASGLSQRLIREAIECGVTKFNVNTDMRSAAMTALKKEVASSSKIDVLNIMETTTKAMTLTAKDKITLFANKKLL